MLLRFSLYGLLKNQRYFEPFLILAYLELGLSFFEIGLLIGFRELAVNVMEIPSGAIADVHGRRKAMIASFVAYIVGFVVLGLAKDLGLVFVAMAFLAVGDAFRTGTHKAMIFTWLRLEGRIDERTKIYGYTRSWSKIGSAISALVAAGIVLATDSYTLVFFFAALPYALNIVNFLGYPSSLDGNSDGAAAAPFWAHLKAAFRNTLGHRGLRRLVAESMGYEGVFHAAKDYLQPVLLAVAASSALGASLGGDLSDVQRSAILIGIAYFGLHLLSSVASRQAHRVSDLAGGEERAARWLWAASVAVFGVVFASGWYDVSALLIAAFVLMHVLQNLWRPALISRIDAFGEQAQGATVLSIESQGRRVATMVLAPLLGVAMDAAQTEAIGDGPFWPIGLVGVVVGFLFLWASLTKKPVSELQRSPSA